jgi:hypothetical protein
MYLVNTRPDICYAVSVLSQFMSQPRQTHWIAAKHVLRYLRGTVGYGLRYASGVDMRLQGYADADWAGSAVDRKSTSGCCFTLGSAMVSWCSRKQTSVALSTAEAEYIALCVAVCKFSDPTQFQVFADFYQCLMPKTQIYDSHKYSAYKQNFRTET